MKGFLSSIGLESLVLTLTDNASNIVKTITEQQTGSPTAGLRISSGAGAGPAAFEITTAAAPEPGDQVVEKDGATIFLDGPASQELDDKVLDAGVDQSGDVKFSLAFQA